MMARGMAINRILDKILKVRLLILFVFFHKLSYFDSKGIANTAIIIAEIMSEGNACIFVKMISSIIITIPIAIANTG